MAFVVAFACNINTTNETILVGNYPTSCKGWQAFSCKNDALLNIFIKFRGILDQTVPEYEIFCIAMTTAEDMNI